METREALGYLKGLLEGLELDTNKKEGKAISAIVDVLSNIVEDIDDITEGMELMAEQLDAVDEDLADVEEYLADEDYDDFDYDCDCCDDDCDCCDDDCDCCDDECAVFEVECPYCKTPFSVDEDTVLDGSTTCPNCGEMLEFEIEECDCEEHEEEE